MVITDNRNSVLYQSGDPSGRFSFTPSYDGTISICMNDQIQGNRRNLPARAVRLNHIHGTTSSQFSEMARKEKLQPIATELRRIEEEVYAVKDEINFQKTREYTFRDTNESINAKCAWLPIIAVIAMGASTAAQIYYLRTFFQKKKLI